MVLLCGRRLWMAPILIEIVRKIKCWDNKNGWEN